MKTFFLQRQAERAGIVQPGEDSRLNLEHIPVPKGGNKNKEEWPFTQADSDRIRGNGFKLKEET